jgi:putative oxidoreductase
MREYGLTVLRVCLAAVFILHGLEQLFGLWGGGLADTAAVVTGLHLPAAYPLSVGAAAAELACGILLLVGAFTMWASAALLIARAAVLYQASVGGRAPLASVGQARAEFELSILIAGALIAILLSGPGALSLDDRRLRSAEREAAARARIRAGKV